MDEPTNGLAVGGIAAGPVAIVDPWGEEIDLTDLDSMADAYTRLKQSVAEQMALIDLLRSRFGHFDKTEDDDKKTRRIQGKVHKVRLELPEVSFEQSLLREIVAKWPTAAAGLVTPASYRVGAVGYKQLVNTTCVDPLMDELRTALIAACRGRVGLPKVVVEE